MWYVRSQIPCGNIGANASISNDWKCAAAPWKSDWPFLQHDWEALLFERMARGFGLNRNGAAFQKLAESIPFYLLRKLAPQLEDLEALFFGQMGLLPETSLGDTYVTLLKERYQYLSHKHNLRPLDRVRPNFGRL